MEQFANPQALAAGMVCVIDLDSVVQRFGSRWPVRREHVHEHVASTLDRQLGPTAYHLRISDTDVLICQPDKERLAGQALCLRALREILTHFLGDGEMADAGVHEVVRISPEGVEARRVDVRVGAAEAAEPVGEAGRAPPPDSPNSLGGANQWTPFVTAYGVGLQVTTRLEPVLQLRERRAIGLRLTNCVAHLRSGRQLRGPELARLTTADLLRIDVAGLLKGLEALLSGGPTGSDGHRARDLVEPLASGQSRAHHRGLAGGARPRGGRGHLRVAAHRGSSVSGAHPGRRDRSPVLPARDRSPRGAQHRPGEAPERDRTQWGVHPCTSGPGGRSPYRMGRRRHPQRTTCQQVGASVRALVRARHEHGRRPRRHTRKPSGLERCGADESARSILLACGYGLRAEGWCRGALVETRAPPLAKAVAGGGSCGDHCRPPLPTRPWNA